MSTHTVYIVAHRAPSGFRAYCLESAHDANAGPESSEREVTQHVIRALVKELDVSGVSCLGYPGTLSLNEAQRSVVADLAARVCRGSVIRVTLNYVQPSTGMWTARY